jgi:hypothetical protein
VSDGGHESSRAAARDPSMHQSFQISSAAGGSGCLNVWRSGESDELLVPLLMGAIREAIVQRGLLVEVKVLCVTSALPTAQFDLYSSALAK